MKAFVNDADYKVTKMVSGKQTMCPYFRVWRNMRYRCSKDSKRNKTYSDCEICDEWYTFSKFKKWMQTQPWEGNELDKDILGDGKLYSPENCCFVPSWVNLLLVLSDSSRGPNPVGVSYMKAGGKLLPNPYQSYIKIGDKKKHLGLFPTPDSAHRAWQTEKVLQMQGATLRYKLETSFQEKIFCVLDRKALALQQDILENRETVSL